IDRKGVGNIVVSYSQPNGTVLDSNIPGTFVIGRNNSVTIPVTVAFTVTLPGGGSYAVKLDKFNWSNSSGRSSVDLKGGEWSTAVISTPFTPPAPVPTPAVPPAIRALKSKALWAAELALTSSRIEFQCYSERQVGTVPAVSVNLNGPATQAAISEATAALIMQISLTSMEVDVRFHSFINGPDGRIIMYGNDTKRPVATKGGYELPMFNVETNINGDQLVPYKDAQSAKITSLDYNGGSLGVRWLEVNSQGFMFSPEAAGNVILEITRNDGTVITFDLRKGIVLTAETLAITAKVGKADTESVIDKIELNIIPITRNGIGFNRLGEIRVTGGPLTVKVAAITEEMGKATSITYRQISPVLGEWVTVPASNGIGTLPNLSKGDWQVIGVFPESVLKEPLYYIYDGKG
ncbi:MAG: hypothetical protein NT077_00360, partial [Candidatus Taylorbacteria bacterium]|nr:hypothetical protein [Candidatus Taylorbacteria bacterium]